MLLLRKITKNFLVIPIIIAIIVTALSSLLIQKQYESVSKLIPVGNSESSAGQASAVSGLLGINLSNESSNNLSSASYFHLLLKSKSVLNELMMMNLGEEYQSQLLIEYHTNKKISNISDSRIDDAIAFFKTNSISVSKDRISSLITVSAIYKDPLVAQKINQFIIQESIQLQRKFNIEYSSNRADYLKKRTNEIEKSLTKIENRMISFLAKNVSLSSKYLEIQYSKIEREVDLLEGVLLTLMQESEKIKIQENTDNNEIQILDNSSFPTSKSSPRLSFILISVFLLTFVSQVFIYLYQDELIKIIKSFESTLKQNFSSPLSNFSKKICSNVFWHYFFSNYYYYFCSIIN